MNAPWLGSMTDDGLSAEKRRIAQAFSKAALSYDEAAQLQRDSAAILLDWLDNQSQLKGRTLDVGCGSGLTTLQLAERVSQVTAMDLSEGMLQVAQKQDYRQRIAQFVCCDVEQLPFAPATFDLVFSNFVMQWCHHLPTAFKQLATVLRGNGRLLMSIPLEGTLWQLTQAWLEADPDRHHVNQFPGKEDVIDGLQMAGFVVDQLNVQYTTQAYENLRELIQSIKALGANHVVGSRQQGLTAKRTLRRLKAAYDSLRDSQGKLPVDWVFLCVDAHKLSKEVGIQHD